MMKTQFRKTIIGGAARTFLTSYIIHSHEFGGHGTALTFKWSTIMQNTSTTPVTNVSLYTWYCSPEQILVCIKSIFGCWSLCISPSCFLLEKEWFFNPPFRHYTLNLMWFRKKIKNKGLHVFPYAFWNTSLMFKNISGWKKFWNKMTILWSVEVLYSNKICNKKYQAGFIHCYIENKRQFIISISFTGVILLLIYT